MSSTIETNSMSSIRNKAEISADVSPDPVSGRRKPNPLLTYSSTAAAVFVSSGIFILLAFTRLWPTDLWDHLNYGRLMLETRNLFRTEPLLPLSQGMPMVNIAWLSQISLHLLNDRFGLSALQFITGLCGGLAVLLLSLRASRHSRSVAAALIAAAVFFLANRNELQIIRPQMAAFPLYTLVLWWAFGRSPVTRFWGLMLPAVFALWSNLHGSFAMGLVAMATAPAGRWLDSTLRTRSPFRALCDRTLIRMILLTQLCAAATLLNPWGLAAWSEVLTFSSSPNLQSMFEWDPLSIRGPLGQSAAVVLGLVFVATAITPRRIRAMEFLLLAATAYQAAWAQRMLSWWLAPAALYIAIHFAAAMRHRGGRNRRRRMPRPAFHWTVLSITGFILAALLNPLAGSLRSGQPRSDTESLAAMTPVETVAQLRAMEKLPWGPVFTRAEWAGYLMNRGPAGLRPMVNLHVHAISEEVWNDYIAIHSGNPGWERRLENYNVNLAVLCKNTQGPLIDQMRKSADWEPVWENRLGLIMRRRAPL